MENVDKKSGWEQLSNLVGINEGVQQLKNIFILDRLS